MKLTIGIKALNEEKHIAESVGSAVAAAAEFAGEVVLADSGSSDRTIEIASGFPVRIVQLAHRGDRCCGAGAQLAFQTAAGEYFYILDGDMVLEKGFMAQAVAFLDANPEYGGVGGHVREMNVANAEFQIRAAKLLQSDEWQPGDVDRLDCGGLYRSAAVRDAGYFADRNLHAFEEFELAARLISRGWKLARIDAPAVRHYGHTTEGYRLLMRRVRSGYSGATGEVLRAALGQPQMGIVLRRLGHIRKALGLIGWWLVLAVMIAKSVPAVIVLGFFLAPFLWFWWRRRSLALVAYTFAVWNSTALGLVTGFLRKRVSPKVPLAIDILAGGRSS